MKIIAAQILILSLFWSCGSENSATYEMKDLTVRGEFLFEGPNTLQGQPNLSLETIAQSLDINPSSITGIHVKSVAMRFEPDSLRSTAESALVQWVSDAQPLVSIATKNPLPDSGTIDLEVNTEQNILPYFKDTGTTLVVDTNLNQDLAELTAILNITISINY